MIEYLKARGFIGIKRGLGLDEIEVDFRGREGMLCFDGKNGSGKSSTLDMLTPFAMLGSRDGALSGHCELRDSLRELTFTHGGHSYRTVLKIDSESGRSEGFVYVDGSTASVTGGKISEYHKWALQTFGSPELFFASLFCSQNSRKLSDMRVGELKGLFVEFLRLERYEGWADTSKQAGNILQGKVEAVEQRMATLQTAANNCDGIHVEILTAGQESDRLSAEKANLVDGLALSRQTAESLKTTIQQNALARERIADIQKQIDRQKEDLAKEKATADQEIATLTARWKEIKAEIVKCDAVLAGRARIEGAAAEEKATQAHLDTLLQEAERLTREIGEAREKAHGLETQLTALRQQVKDLDPMTDPENVRLGKLVDEAERAVKDKEREIYHLDGNRELTALESQMEHFRTTAKALEVKDPGCKSTSCSFIVGALEAADKMVVAGKRIEEIREEIEAKKAELNKAIEAIKEQTAFVLTDKAARLAQLDESRRTINEKIKDLDHDLRNVQTITLNGDRLIKKAQADIARDRATLTTLKALAARLPEIQVAEQRKADLCRQLGEVERAGAEKKTAWETKAKEADDRLQYFLGAKAAYRIDEEAEGKLTAIQGEIDEIEKASIPAIELQIADAREKVVTLKADLTRIEEAEKELEVVRQERESLAAQVARWRYLQNVCGKNGLQALEIDGAAPLIASRANELLMQGYGPQYTVRIDTQDEQGREDLDIKVLSEWGTDSLKDKSGGEKIWLLHPVRLAMALLSKEKSGRDFDVAMMDEIDGPLDREGAATNFMEMYRPFMKLGGIRQLFFITHREACLSYADHVLRFEAGKQPCWA